MSGTDQPAMRLLQVSAYVVIVAWGITAASHILSVILISLLLAYALLPLPKWLKRRFALRKGPAILLTVALVMAAYLVVFTALYETSFQMRAKLPLYAQHASDFYQRIAGFLSVYGIQSASLSFQSFYRSERMIGLMEATLFQLVGLVSDRVLVAMLSLLFLVEMVEVEGANRGRLARNLAYYGEDIQRFITISAQTGAITALANLVLLVALRVDFPVLWCFLYFLLHFIPNVGFIISLVPPALVTLLTFGWKRSLVVLVGFVLTQIVSDYVLQPMLMKKSLHISFFQLMLALLIWGFLLGPVGAILAIPLTLVLKKFIQNPLVEPSMVRS